MINIRRRVANMARLQADRHARCRPRIACARRPWVAPRTALHRITTRSHITHRPITTTTSYHRTTSHVTTNAHIDINTYHRNVTAERRFHYGDYHAPRGYE